MLPQGNGSATGRAPCSMEAQPPKSQPQMGASPSEKQQPCTQAPRQPTTNG